MPDISEYKVGVVLATESLGAKTKSSKALTSCTVNVGGDGEPLTIVTSATNVREGSRIIVAPVGSTFVDDEGEERSVTRATVGGIVSEGMLCDSKMLGWSGGAKGIAATLPEEFELGSAPPSAKPRPKGADGGGGGDGGVPESAGPGLFEKKLTKEEKKKLAEERKKARKAKKEAAKAAAED